MEEINNIISSRFSIPKYHKLVEANIGPTNEIEEESDEKLKLSIEHLEKQGFFCVINNPDKPKEAFNRLLESHKKERDTALDHIKETHLQKTKQYEEQILSFQNILVKEKENLEKYLIENKHQKEGRCKELKDEIKDLESQIRILSEAIATKKEHGIDERIQQVRKELKGLIETLEEITKKKDEIEDKSYVRDKETLKKYRDFWENLSQKYEDVIDALKDKSILFFKNGITPRVAHFFNFTGTLATILAGWLFAIFSSVRKIDDEDWLFFILESLQSFGEIIQTNNDISDWKWVLLFLSFFIGMLIVVTLIGRVCMMLFDLWVTKPQKKSNNKTDDDLIEDARISPPRFLVSWLHWAPYIFIGAIIYVVIQIGTDLTKLKALDISLSGQAVGSGLALIIGGLGFAYINNIIIPRYKNSKGIGGSSLKIGLRLLGKSLELILLILVFITTFVIMYMNDENGAGALFGFVCVSLISGYLLGNGIRYNGLLDTKRHLENKLFFFKQRALKDKPLSSLKDLDKGGFVLKFRILEQELLNLLIIKTQQLNPRIPNAKYSLLIKEQRLEDDTSKEKKRPFYTGIAKSIFNVFKKKEKKQNQIQNVTHITQHEKIMFPVEADKIEALEDKFKEKKQELRTTISAIEDINEENTGYQKEVKLLESTVLEEINDCRTQIVNELNYRNEKIAIQVKENIQYTIALQNGYDLGYWHLKYGTDNGFKQ